MVRGRSAVCEILRAVGDDRVLAFAPPRLWTRVLKFSLLAVGSWGCEERESPSRAAGRSEAILAAPGQNAKSDEAPGPAPVAEKKASTRAALCDARPNSPFPRKRTSGLGTFAQPFEGGVPASNGLTWVSLWAAWCEPCKKEIPLLLETEERLRKGGLDFRVEFISIDDDERQLSQFLASAPPGLKKTFWLKEGRERENWLAEAGLPADPRLPVQLLVNQEGKIFCRIDGSIDEADLPAVEKTVKAASL